MEGMSDVIKIIGAIMVVEFVLALAIRGFEVVKGVRF